MAKKWYSCFGCGKNTGSSKAHYCRKCLIKRAALAAQVMAAVIVEEERAKRKGKRRRR